MVKKYQPNTNTNIFVLKILTEYEYVRFENISRIQICLVLKYINCQKNWNLGAFFLISGFQGGLRHIICCEDTICWNQPLRSQRAGWKAFSMCFCEMIVDDVNRGGMESHWRWQIFLRMKIYWSRLKQELLKRLSMKNEKKLSFFSTTPTPV